MLVGSKNQVCFKSVNFTLYQ